ncbi:MAG: hypothetical protein RI907_2365 [Pseudomonadota bacterium]|jgi:hypothetical protein
MCKPVNRERRRGWLAAALACMLVGPVAAAPAKPVFCAWDILGKAGDTYAMVQDYALAMAKQGVDFEVKAYLDERVAAEDYRTGQCAGVILTGFRARPFNQTSGSLDSMGSTTVVKDGRIDMGASYDVLHRLVVAFASAQASNLMVEGVHEVGGIVPIGAAYPIVRDRAWAPLPSLAGKRIGAFDNDRAQAWLVQKLGGQPVPVDVTSVGTKFNNGMMDVIYLPALTYRPFELSKGMGPKGAFVKLPVMLPTFQVVLNRQVLPQGVGQASRQWWASQFDRAMGLVAKAEASVPPAAWHELAPDQVAPYVDMLKQGRLQGVDEGLYSKRTLNMLKKARCLVSPASAECATPQEVL